MTNEQTPAAKLTNEQYFALLHKIGKILKELDQMSAMVGDIEADRQSKEEDNECYDLYKIEKAIRFGQQKIHKMKDMIGDVME